MTQTETEQAELIKRLSDGLHKACEQRDGLLDTCRRIHEGCGPPDRNEIVWVCLASGMVKQLAAAIAAAEKGGE